MRARALLLSTALLVVLTSAIAHAQTPPPGAAWDSVAQILKTPASATGGYYRYGLPRRDVTLKIGDVTVSPALALGGWAGFSGEPSDATVMGDLVLLAAEVKPVLAELGRQRLDVTAVTSSRCSPTCTFTVRGARPTSRRGSTACSRARRRRAP